MTWPHAVSWFFGGMFLANAVPHVVAGMQGRPFQSPFAKPPGEGLSSSTVNVVWGAFNLVVAYFLLVHVGAFEFHDLEHVAIAGAGGLLLSLGLARHFGRFHGGNNPS